MKVQAETPMILKPRSTAAVLSTHNALSIYQSESDRLCIVDLSEEEHHVVNACAVQISSILPFYFYI